MSETITTPETEPTEAPPVIAWTYARPGTYLIGVPARDMTQEEFDALAPELQAAVRDSGLYTTSANNTAKE